MQRVPGVPIATLSAIVAVVWTGCVTPAERVDAQASSLGFTRTLVEAVDAPLVVFQRSPSVAGDRLHVYLGGDGSPRRASRFDPPDPTPRSSVALRLMALDPQPSLYLGRPCHHGTICSDPRQWTVARYGEAVVAAMETAMRGLLRERGAHELVLVGFSGGGTLAMLLAERLPEVSGIVTIAGNLDPVAWTRHHGYSELVGSLNPAERAPLRADVSQLHLRGGRDDRIPPELTQRAIDRQPGARQRSYPDFDHRCCWESVWTSVLDELDAVRSR